MKCIFRLKFTKIKNEAKHAYNKDKPLSIISNTYSKGDTLWTEVYSKSCLQLVEYIGGLW